MIVGETEMILVTGSTGANGTELCAALSKAGVAARAMVRSPETHAAQRLAALPHMELITGDFDDPASLARALDGVKRAFLLTPSTERAEEQQMRFVEAARAADVRHIVKLSQFAPDPTSPVRFLRYHAAVEAAIRASGMAWTFLRPNLFMQGLLAFAPAIRTGGGIAAPIGDAPVSVVDIRDIAAVATAALTGDGYAGATYPLTGPESLTHPDMAERLTNALGRTVPFREITPDEMRDLLVRTGMNRWQVDGLVEDYAHYSRGEAAEVTDGVRAATGKPPRDFDHFARDYAAAFAA